MSDISAWVVEAKTLPVWPPITRPCLKQEKTKSKQERPATVSTMAAFCQASYIH